MKRDPRKGDQNDQYSWGRGAVRPFRISVPEEDLVDLRRRIAATRWPDKQTVSDRSQGVQLAKLRPLVEYWGTDYDWRKVEATLNALPGVTPSPPLFVPGPVNDRIWHIAFNRVAKVNEQLVRGREDIYFGFEFEREGRRARRAHRLPTTRWPYDIHRYAGPASPAQEHRRDLGRKIPSNALPFCMTESVR